MAVEVTAFQFGRFLVNALKGSVDWENATVKVALVTDSYSPDQDADEFWSDVAANEASGDGYTAGGATLANATLSYDAASNTITLDGNDVAWADSTIEARYAVVYVDSGSAATSPLAGYTDFGQNESSSNGTFQVSWNPDGIYTVTVD